MVKQIILKALGRFYRIVFSVGSTRECPICAWTGFMFLPFGPPGMRRYDAKCPKCGSLERHRLAFLALDRFGIKESENTLHIAPEFSIIGLLKKISMEYYTIDKHNPAMQKMDLTNLAYKDSSFSLIWCSHVLEHIDDDMLALKEIYRVCKSGGIAVIQVPIWGHSTYQRVSVNTDQERLNHYYQKDHLRRYGLDIVDKFENIGFASNIVRTQDFNWLDIIRFSLSNVATNEVFFLRK